MFQMNEGCWEVYSRPVRIRSFKFLCMNSAVIFGPIAKAARSVILASGTLSPTMTFESELGTKFANKLHASHVISKDQVYIRGIAKGPTGVVLRATYQNTKQLSFQVHKCFFAFYVLCCDTYIFFTFAG